MTDYSPLPRSPQFQLDVEHFLAHHWQQRPLLIRQALPDFTPPVTAHELAGLAMEPEVESRIVEQRQDGWHLQHGPFREADFQRNCPWTLLVQRVDQWRPEVASLRGCVDFLPEWRFDDVMVSYASDGGSVGPHFDRYDVFLLQGEGQRRWLVGERCDDRTPQLNHPDLSLLRDFVTVEEFVLSPGDALYVPPGFAHWGIAEGPCTTFSLGFRAPRIADLTARLTDAVLERLAPELLLADHGSILPDARPGELSLRQRENARTAIINALDALDDGIWLGELLTEGAPDVAEPTGELPAHLVRDPIARMVWFETEQQINLFANGEALTAPHAALDMLMALSSGRAIAVRALPADLQSLVAYLWRQGVLTAPEELQ
ncbi:MAG: cupin domain-containing protein [Halieaceae bacterium]|nr:cupin domain-containing protein [Halieaceae bacterium]